MKRNRPEMTGQRRTDAPNPPSHLSDYLAGLGQNGQRAPESAHAGQPFHARDPRGDRRMSAEQRWPQPVTRTADLPYWSAYLNRLGEQVKHTAGFRRWRRVLVKPRAVAMPIGNRRTGIRSRRRSDKVNPGLTMGGWNYYFVAKLVLFGWSLIGFHPLLNLVLAAFILFPASTRVGALLKGIVTTVLALALFYHDSWLPPLDRLWSQAALVSSFSLDYLLELIGRFVRLMVVGGLLLSWVLCRLIARRLRVSVLVILAMMAVGGWQLLSENEVAAPAAPQLDKELRDFFLKESSRSVPLIAPAAAETPFDVIFLHVCSLSWDDVRAVGLDQHPLWRRFDILLTRFNSVASYSGPAALHLMRATCGQPEHGQMYVAATDNCYLMKSLKNSGFTPELALNHDGRFDDFLGQLRQHGRLDAPPLPLAGLPVAQRAFDDSPVYSDLSVLSRWLETRRQDGQPRVALYYNTVSLHDGNHLPDEHALPNTLASYRTRLGKFLDETEAFIQKLEQSGQRAVVVMVPEHGGAVRGDAMQIAGLREIPTPAITLVPVGIRLTGGMRKHAGQPLVVDQPTSFLAISGIIQHMLAHSPFNPAPVDLATYLDDLQQTRFVAQNEKTVSIEFHGQYYFSHSIGDWQSLGGASLPDPGSTDGALSAK